MRTLEHVQAFAHAHTHRGGAEGEEASDSPTEQTARCGAPFKDPGIMT